MWLSGTWCTTCRTVHPPGRYGVSSWASLRPATAARIRAGQRGDLLDRRAPHLVVRRHDLRHTADWVLKIGDCAHFIDLRISRAASFPLAPVMKPPGCVPALHM